jgi:hypothetical protein
LSIAAAAGKCLVSAGFCGISHLDRHRDSSPKKYNRGDSKVTPVVLNSSREKE